MTVLAIDPGTSLGWAFRDKEGVITHGTLDLKPGRHEGAGMRFLKLKRWLTETKNGLGDLEELVFEDVRGHKGTYAAQIYGGIVATITAWCEANEIPYRGIKVSEWKKPLTGKGNCSKDLCNEAVKRLGYQAETSDEYDAIGILMAA